jgi:hypothetical protein
MAKSKGGSVKLWSGMKPEFAAKKGSKPGAVAKAEKFDNKSDKKIAKKFGVKYTG